MTDHPAPERLRRCGLDDVRTNRQPDQALTPSSKVIALLLGDAILAFSTERAQQRAKGGAA